MYTLLLSVALADPQPAQVLPGAAPIDRRTGETSWGLAAGYATGEPAWWVAGAVLTGIWGVSERVAVNGGLGLSVPEASVWPMVGVRVMVLDRPELHVAPFAVLVGRYRTDNHTLFTVSGLGLAAEGGWERVRLDASVPLVGATRGSTWPSSSTGLPQPFLLSTLEAGVTLRLTEAHDLRVGVLSLLPTVSWRYAPGRWFLEASVSSFGLQGAAQARAGLRL